MTAVAGNNGSSSGRVRTRNLHIWLMSEACFAATPTNSEDLLKLQNVVLVAMRKFALSVALGQGVAFWSRVFRWLTEATPLAEAPLGVLVMSLKMRAGSIA